MRVVLVVHRFPEPSETFIASKFVGLVDRGVDVHVACAEERPRAWPVLPVLAGRDELRDRVHAVRSGGVRSGQTGLAERGEGREGGAWDGLARSLRSLVEARPHPGHLAGYAGRLVRDLRRDVPDGLLLDGCIAALRPRVVHYEFSSLAAQRTALRQLLDCRLTVSVRGWDLNFWSLDQPDAYRSLWAAVDAVHCLGRDLLERARHRGLPPDVPVSLIPPAIDTAFFRPPPPSERRRPAEGPLRLVTVARLHWKKGHEHALAAVGMLRQQGVDVRYRIVGGGEHVDAVRAAVAAHGLDDVVELVGHAPPGQVRDELARADALVHAAVSEGFSNAVLEAQSMAVPVVCTDADGLAENVVEGVTGFVVPRRQPQMLADRLARLASDPALGERMGRAGRERATAHFGLGRQIDRWAEFYQAVAAGRRPPPS